MRIGNIITRSFVLALLGTTNARLAAAQSRWSAAFELAGGTATGYGGKYDGNRHYPVLRAALGGRFAVTRHIGIFADLDAENVGITIGEKVSCAVSVPGGCSGSFPMFSGYLLAAGVSVRPLPAVELRAGIGPGSSDRSGFVNHVFFGTAEITVDFLPYVGVSAAVRDMFLLVYGEHLRIVPLTFGVRIH
jgi:hypothetical protein